MSKEQLRAGSNYERSKAGGAKTGDIGRQRATSGGGQLIAIPYRYDSQLAIARCRLLSPDVARFRPTRFQPLVL